MIPDRERLEDLLTAYEIDGEIGRGGWGVVLAGTHRALGRRVAIKHLPIAFGADPQVRNRFHAEARLAASLDHPHIVPIYDYMERDGLCVIVMEHLAGGTLWNRFTHGQISQQQAVAIIIGLCSALQYAHDRGVVHRDVKPDNVLFTTSGVPKLADFGIAKVLGESQALRTATGLVVGTPAYIAPERARGEEPGPSSDVYAAAIVVYELLAGRLPFEATSDPLTLLYRQVNEPPLPLVEAAPGLPPALSASIDRALAKVPADRYPSAAAFAAAMAAAATDAWGSGWLEGSGVPLLGTRFVPDAVGERADSPRQPRPASAASTRTVVSQSVPEAAPPTREPPGVAVTGAGSPGAPFAAVDPNRLAPTLTAPAPAVPRATRRTPRLTRRFAVYLGAGLAAVVAITAVALTANMALSRPSDPATLAGGVIDAWKRGDRGAVERVATPTAAEQLFSRAPVAAEFGGCEQIGSASWTCNYWSPEGTTVLVKMNDGSGTLTVDQIEFLDGG